MFSVSSNLRVFQKNVKQFSKLKCPTVLHHNMMLKFKQLYQVYRSTRRIGCRFYWDIVASNWLLNFANTLPRSCLCLKKSVYKYGFIAISVCLPKYFYMLSVWRTWSQNYIELSLFNLCHSGTCSGSLVSWLCWPVLYKEHRFVKENVDRVSSSSLMSEL